MFINKLVCQKLDRITFSKKKKNYKIFTTTNCYGRYSAVVCQFARTVAWRMPCTSVLSIYTTLLTGPHKEFFWKKVFLFAIVFEVTGYPIFEYPVTFQLLLLCFILRHEGKVLCVALQ